MYSHAERIPVARVLWDAHPVHPLRRRGTPHPVRDHAQRVQTTTLVLCMHIAYAHLRILRILPYVGLCPVHRDIRGYPYIRRDPWMCACTSTYVVITHNMPDIRYITCNTTNHGFLCFVCFPCYPVHRPMGALRSCVACILPYPRM